MGKKRRGNGEGSIYQRTDGRWCGAISLGYDENGKLKRRVIYGKTKGEVKEKMLPLQHDALHGKPIEPNKLTVEQHFDDWLRTKKPPKTKSATYGKYDRLYRTHIKPIFGRLKLQALDYRRINAFYEHLDNQGLAPSTVSAVASVLSMALDDAARKGLVAANPVNLAEERPATYGEARCLTHEELKRFLEAAKGEYLEQAFIVAVHTGLRPGELLGLAWSSVDLEGRTLTVRQTLHEEDGKLFIGDPKTKAARRTISLSETAIQALRRQRRLQLEMQLRSGGAWQNEHALVFTNQKGGFLRRTNILRRDLRRICTKAGIEGMSLHTFRHTHVSLLIAAGVDIKTISKRIGHENEAFTLRTYGHMMPGQDEKASRKMDELMASL